MLINQLWNSLKRSGQTQWVRKWAVICWGKPNPWMYSPCHRGSTLLKWSPWAKRYNPGPPATTQIVPSKRAALGWGLADAWRTFQKGRLWAWQQPMGRWCGNLSQSERGILRPIYSCRGDSAETPEGRKPWGLMVARGHCGLNRACALPAGATALACLDFSSGSHCALLKDREIVWETVMLTSVASLLGCATAAAPQASCGTL